MQSKYANHATKDLHSNLSYEIFQNGTELIYLGAWPFTGQAQYAYDGTDAIQASDNRRATGLVASAPSVLADVFKNARANNLFMLGEQKRLAGLGYTQKALIDAIKQKVNFAFSELDTLAQNVMAEKDRAAALVLLTQTTFKKSSESEAQQIAFDLAVIAKLGILSPAERGSLSQGDLMPRLDSDRLQAALSRVPAEIHGLPADQVDLMRTIYAAKTWPRSTHATGLVGDMVAAAARAITSAVVTLEKLSGTPDGSLFNKLSGGKFFAEFRGGIAMTDSDFQAAKMAQRFTQGMPQAIIGDTFA